MVLPEFFNNEYFPQYRDARYMDYAEAEDGYTQTRMKAEARRHGIHVVSTIFEMARPGLLLRHRDAHRPRGRNRRQVPEGASGGAAEPGEDLLPRRLVVPGVSRGRVDRRIFDLLRQPVPGILPVPGAERRRTDHRAIRDAGGDPWENFFTTRALENGVFLAACNHVGLEGEWQMSGKSMVIDPLGEIVAKASERERGNPGGGIRARTGDPGAPALSAVPRPAAGCLRCDHRNGRLTG